jgi:dTDP-4-dehydrorhamnose 3,5-epimerase
MKVISTSLTDVLNFEPSVFGDSRGFFFESFSQRFFDESVGRHVKFLQDNHSKSSKGVLRGLHYQLDPNAQGKLVRCVQGEVLDIAVDIRKSSSSFGQWVGVILNAENKRQLWIPEGFAHGFVTLSDTAEFVYKTTNYYAKESERSILWNDPEIGIDWTTQDVLLSDKDLLASEFKNAEVFE